MSGVFSLLATCVPIGGTSAAFAIIGRFSVNISYNIGLQYCAEILPTVSILALKINNLNNFINIKK